MDWIEIIAFVFSLISVIGLANRKVYGWYASIIGVIAFFVLFYQEKLYMDMGLQIFFLIQSVIGIVNWSKNSKDEDFEIKKISWKDFFMETTIVIILGLLIGHILSMYTNANQPYLDSTLTIVCLLANHYLVKKVIQSWILWISVDVLYLVLFLNQGMYVSLTLYVLFLINSIRAFIQWRNIKNITTD